jgi:exoribonuclease-2
VNRYFNYRHFPAVFHVNGWPLLQPERVAMNIRNNSLVLYKNGPARVAALGDKLEIELEDGRSLRVRPKDVALLHPGPLSGLRGLDAPAGEAEAACELLEGNGQPRCPIWLIWSMALTPRRPPGLLGGWCMKDCISRVRQSGLCHGRWPRWRGNRRERAAKAAEREAWNGFLARARAGRCAPEDAPI